MRRNKLLSLLMDDRRRPTADGSHRIRHETRNPPIRSAHRSSWCPWTEQTCFQAAATAKADGPPEQHAFVQCKGVEQLPQLTAADPHDVTWCGVQRRESSSSPTSSGRTPWTGVPFRISTLPAPQD